MKRNYQFGFILFFLLTTLCGFSQEGQNKIVVTFDLGGNSGGYSFNGEYEFFRKDKYILNARLGFGYLPIKETNFISIPFGVNLLKGNQKHNLEIGIGASYIKGLSISIFQIGKNIQYFPSAAMYFVPSVGYRFDKLAKGLILKAYYSPLILISDFIDKENIINIVTKDVILPGTTTREEYFYNSYGKDLLPEAKSKFGYFGISCGYRF
jgi:hypothetical protein